MEENLSTEHLKPSIKARSISGAIANGGGQAAQFLLTVAYNATLARLISPHDFGLVAIAAAVAGFLQIFKDAGLSTATIQRENITNAQVSNLFWINLAVGVAAMVLLATTAPIIAWFFNEPALVGIARALSIVFLCDGLVVQHAAILNRQMRFALMAGIEFGCAAIGFGVGTVMALGNWGYWSLVGATLSTAVIRAATIWGLSRWRPQRPSARSGTRPLVRFGTDLTLVGVVYAFSRACDSILIGRYLGSDAVGLYSRAKVLIVSPLERLIAPIYAVIVPALSRLRAEPIRYRNAYIALFEGLAIVAFGLAGLLLPLADLLVRVILGDKWTASAPIFASLTPIVVYLPLSTASSWLYTSQGRGRDLLLTASVGAVVVVGSFLAGLTFGVTGVAIAYSTSALLVLLPFTYYIAGRTGPVSSRDLWLATIGHAPVFFAVVAVTWLCRAWIAYPTSSLSRLLFCTAVGGLAGVAAIFTFTRSRRVSAHLIHLLREHFAIA